MAQRERDVYQLLARRWKSRLHAQLGEEIDDNLEDAAISMLFGATDNVSIFRLLRRFQAQEEDTDSEEEDNESYGEDDQSESEDDGVAMDEDDDSSSGMIAHEPATAQLFSPSTTRKMLNGSTRTVTTVSSSSVSEEDDI